MFDEQVAGFVAAVSGRISNWRGCRQRGRAESVAVRLGAGGWLCGGAGAPRLAHVIKNNDGVTSMCDEIWRCCISVAWFLWGKIIGPFNAPRMPSITVVAVCS